MNRPDKSYRSARGEQLLRVAYWPHAGGRRTTTQAERPLTCAP